MQIWSHRLPTPVLGDPLGLNLLASVLLVMNEPMQKVHGKSEENLFQGQIECVERQLVIHLPTCQCSPTQINI